MKVKSVQKHGHFENLIVENGQCGEEDTLHGQQGKAELRLGNQIVDSKVVKKGDLRICRKIPGTRVAV